MSLHILIISDNELFAAYLTDLLQDAGHAVTCTPKQDDAFRAIKRQKPDLALIAVEASQVAALAVEHRLRSAHGIRQVPVIVISECLRLEAELLLVFDFIPKPLDVKRLFLDLEAVARRKENRIPMLELSDELAGAFAQQILSSTGLHFELRNKAALKRGLTKRMTALRLESFQEYLEYLKSHGENRHELQKLLPFLTVGETYFFRYPAHFEALKERFSSLPDRRPIRIWSAGCSTGEEPYSIAIALMEALPDWRERDIRIIATDINNRSLKQARDGVYSPWAMRITEPHHRKRYFDQVGQSFLIKDEVKQLVEFHHLNLSAPCNEKVCEDLHELDAIFCRNVLIYFTVETAEQMLQRFADSLRLSGLLFLGHSESLLQRTLDLEVHRQQGTFYYVKAPAAPRPRPVAARGGSAAKGAKTIECAPTGHRPWSEQKPTAVRQQTPEEPPPVLSAPPSPLPCADGVPPPELPTVEAARQLFDREEFDLALRIIGEILEQNPEDAEALVLQGFIQAGKGEMEEALRACDRALSRNDLMPEAYFLRGVVLDAGDRLQEAADEYRKALLLDHDFIMPRYHMGRLHLRLGRVDEAAREIRNSIRILARGKDEQIVPFSGGLTRAVCMLQLQNALAQVA